MRPMGFLRAAAIALGSLVAAWLVVWLVMGVLFPGANIGPTALILTVVIGGAIYADIRRRERRAA